jgi:hypothetical protein
LRICTCKAPHVEAVHVHKSHCSRTSQQPWKIHLGKYETGDHSALNRRSLGSQPSPSGN